MNLDGCTPGQRASIRHVDGPLLVSAGAGSGKTFTLTQRIAYALLPDSGPAVDGIDEVLAITFTEKAAAEIKARVKRTLRAEGLGAEALKVDGAWISTIHGMCARILRTHALDLGIDPAFGIVGDAERADLVAGAIDAALGSDNDIVSRGSYAALFDEYPARSSMRGAPSVSSMLQTLMDKAVGLRGGLDAVDFGPPPPRASALARDLLLAYEELQPALDRAGKSTTAERARAQALEAAEALQDFVIGCGSADDGGEDMRAFAAVANGCARIGGNFNAEAKPAVKEFQAVYDHTAQRVAAALAWPRASELMALAHEVARRYECAKRRLGKLDNDDLLTCTLAAFEEHPDIAWCYEDRFKLVMVDEFQDTSQLQIDMISRLAGPGCAHLCTVGDAQQSIYRFRGADVNVYEAHKRTMRSPDVDALYVELTKNFRSHAGVLSFVDRVFEQPHVFGDAFMSLEPNDARPSRYRGSAPRIDIVLAVRPSARGSGVRSADAKREAARQIAIRFAALREDGHRPGDMVVLLGRMSSAHVYAEALRDQGFECVVAGGSLFASAPEVRLVGRLLEALANPANTAALFEVLASDMMRLSADDFLLLSTEEDPDSGHLRRRNLDRGLTRLADAEGLSERLANAVRLLGDGMRASRTRSASQTVLDVVVRSGWLARLEDEGAAGAACAANVLKAVRMIERIEGERHAGLAQTARAFRDELAAGPKEAPGALSGSEGDVVKIMTIHASKGLEFPIVALADFADGSSRSGKLMVETCGPVARAALAPAASMEPYPQLAKRLKPYPTSEDGDPDAHLAAATRLIDGDGGALREPVPQNAYREAVARRADAEELAEARRKLYVGLTRASEALVVVMDAKVPAPDKPFAYPDLVDDIRSALCGSGDFPESKASLPYGGSEPARFERVLVRPSGEDGEDDGDAPAFGSASPAAAAGSRGSDASVFRVPEPPYPARPRSPWAGARDGVFSYSSIAAACDDQDADPASDAPSAFPDAGGAGAAGRPGASRGPRPRGPDLRLLDGDAPVADPSAVGSRLPDTEAATGLGSAFHRAAQFEVETGARPDAARLDALAATYGLSGAQRARLHAACDRWFNSPPHARSCAWPLRRAEVPFFVAIGDAHMEGEIDLLCTEGPEGRGAGALVVDYKTGGRDEETPEQLHAKHLLQARCYAYALLSQGYGSVELLFVRVEREDETGGPQTVPYAFDAEDLPDLERAILSACG